MLGTPHRSNNLLCISIIHNIQQALPQMTPQTPITAMCAEVILHIQQLLVVTTAVATVQPLLLIVINRLHEGLTIVYERRVRISRSSAHILSFFPTTSLRPVDREKSVLGLLGLVCSHRRREREEKLLIVATSGPLKFHLW